MCVFDPDWLAWVSRQELVLDGLTPGWLASHMGRCGAGLIAPPLCWLTHI